MTYFIALTLGLYTSIYASHVSTAAYMLNRVRRCIKAIIGIMTLFHEAHTHISNVLVTELFSPVLKSFVTHNCRTNLLQKLFHGIMVDFAQKHR